MKNNKNLKQLDIDSCNISAIQQNLELPSTLHTTKTLRKVILVEKRMLKY